MYKNFNIACLFYKQSLKGVCDANDSVQTKNLFQSHQNKNADLLFNQCLGFVTLLEQLQFIHTIHLEQ